MPVQEIEAWILADIRQAIPKVIPSSKPAKVAKPESIASPKEELLRLSRGSNKIPRCDYTVHNPRVSDAGAAQPRHGDADEPALAVHDWSAAVARLEIAVELHPADFLEADAGAVKRLQ